MISCQNNLINVKCSFVELRRMRCIRPSGPAALECRTRWVNRLEAKKFMVRASAVSVDRALRRPGQHVKKVNMVYKFGGSSVATAERMEEVADIVCSFPEYYPCVVLSAMGDTTNVLLDCAGAALATSSSKINTIPGYLKIRERHLEAAEKLKVSDDVHRSVDELLEDLKELLTGISMLQELTPKAKDHIVSFGERLSTRLFSGYLNSNQVEAANFDAWNLGFVSTDDFTNADVVFGLTLPGIKKSISALKGEIPIVTGFLAKGQKTGSITTLGRAGSDRDWAGSRSARGAGLEGRGRSAHL